MPPLTLKQRLAALANAQSSPSPPRPERAVAPPPVPPKKRAFFTPWAKRSTDNILEDERRRLAEAMSRMIYQAGVDHETRPMVVVNASALPDPRDVSYDALLTRVLGYLNLYVEADYTVVFFAAGGRHTPGWNWVWKAYRSLSRKYRKNLKKLYIVHSSFFSKMLFSLAGAIISPKFFQKLSYIDTLSGLAMHVPLTQIDIPPAVYQENLKYETTITLPSPTRSNIFGVPLEDLMGFDGEKGGVPRVVRDCIQFIRESGMDEQGLFRRSPNSAMLRQAREAYDRGQVVSLNTFGDPHLAAVLLKKYIRDLPEPLFPERLYTTIRRCPFPFSESNDLSSVLYIREQLLPELPPCGYILLTHVLHLMHEVSQRSDVNLMDAHNLAVVLCPNLVSSSNPLLDVAICGVPGGASMFESPPTPPSQQESSPNANAEKTSLGAIIKLCIQRYYEVFDETADRSEAIQPQSEETQSRTTPSSGSPTSSQDSFDDDEDIDDAVLVMPVAPSHRSHHSIQHNSNIPIGSTQALSAWSTGGISPSPSGTQKFRKHRNTLSGESASSGARSMFSSQGEGMSNSPSRTSISKARSTISIEKSGTLGAGKKGSISIGRGTLRKSPGAGVEAIGITAEGFFTPPSNAPPVPLRR